MRGILIIENNKREQPGILEELLKERKIPYTIIDLDQGEIFPPMENYGAVVVLGGPDSANDKNEKIQNELQKIQKILNAGVPYLGICLGLQLLVKAVGGKVIKNPTREIGFRGPDNNYFTVELTDAGRKDPLLEGIEDTFQTFHLHEETIEMTSTTTLLAAGKFCKNQIVKIDHRAYGAQCHFEMTPELFKMWTREEPHLQKVDKEKLQNDFEISKEKYMQTGKKIFENFLKIAGF